MQSNQYPVCDEVSQLWIAPEPVSLLPPDRAARGWGTMKKTKEACCGCYNDDYNRGLGGSKECWSYKSAKIIKRIGISVHRPPPYDKDSAEPMMDCYTRKQMVYVNPEVLDDKGFWK